MNRSTLEDDLRELLAAQARAVRVADQPPIELVKRAGIERPWAPRAGRVLMLAAAVAVVVGGLAGIVATRDRAPASSSEPVGSGAPLGSVDTSQADDIAPATTIPLVTTIPSVTTAAPSDAGLDGSGRIDPIVVLMQLVETSRLANDAVMEQTDECMTAAGFEFERAQQTDFSVASIEQLYRPWSSPDVSTAAEFGYQPAAEMPANLLPPDPQRSGDYETAIYGVETGTWELAPDDQVFDQQALSGPILDGCFPTAQREIIGGGEPSKSFFINDTSYFLQSINNTAARTVLESDAIEALQPEWSDCMEQSGYTYTEFTEVPRNFVGTNDPDDFELAVATTDAQCRDTTGIADLGDQLFDVAASAGIETRQDAMSFITTELDALGRRVSAPDVDDQEPTATARTDTAVTPESDLDPDGPAAFLDVRIGDEIPSQGQAPPVEVSADGQRYEGFPDWISVGSSEGFIIGFVRGSDIYDNAQTVESETRTIVYGNNAEPIGYINDDGLPVID